MRSIVGIIGTLERILIVCLLTLPGPRAQSAPDAGSAPVFAQPRLSPTGSAEVPQPVVHGIGPVNRRGRGDSERTWPLLVREEQRGW